MANSICSSDGCERKHYARGLCTRHYDRQRRKPDWAPLTTEQRFWVQVEKTDECWMWRGTVNAMTGYGYYADRRVHRTAYEWLVGPIPDAMHLDHTCFNRVCVNPNHLRVVTQKQNNENQRLRSDNKSGVRGVHQCTRTGRWVASIGHFGQVIYLGRYKTVDEAEKVVVAKRNELFTHNDLDRQESA